MAIQTKASRMAIVTETTEGTPKAPSAGTEYIALQDGYSLEANFDVLENAELTGSIGAAKPVQGLENPAVSLDHYFRHSGVEGQAPNFGKLIEGITGGKTVNATEYDTVSSSTAGSASAAAVVKVDTGEGANFERGQALLIKDSTNGYSIRNVLSISSDDLTMNFNLPGAPASGVNLGKAVLYKPGSSYPTFTVFDYRGNGGATQMVAGAKVKELSIAAKAGDFITGSFSMDALSYYFDPIEIKSTNKYIDFNDGGVKAAQVVVGWYKDPKDLAAAIKVAMDGVSTDNFTVTYSSSTGKFTIATDGASLSLLSNTGTNVANSIWTTIGFSTAANHTSALTYTGANAISFASPHTPSFDSADPLVAKANEVLIGDFASGATICPSEITTKVTNEKVDILCVRATSGKVGSEITGRKIEVELKGTLDQYDVDKFYRFRTNQETSFMYNFGEKSGGNWVAGKCGNIYLPTATISKFNVTDQDGLAYIELTVTAFVSGGLGEYYINFV